MGLDMFLFRQKKFREGDDAYNKLVRETSEEVMYWRKANQIRSWIVNNTIYEDNWNCEEVELTKETLEKLKADCETVMDDHSKARTLFPTSNGFFFGSTDYDEWYFNKLETTAKEIGHILKDTDFENEIIYYTEWW